MRRFRRLSQLLFFVFFLILFFAARDPYKTPVPSEIFLQSSPLAAVTVFLTSRSLFAPMLLSVVVLILSLVLGRIFCGWVCPLGTIIDAADKFIKPKIGFMAPAGTRWKNAKFIILIAILIASLFSVQWAGYFDPLALLWRTFTVVIFPVVSFISFTLFQLIFNIGLFEDAAYWLYDLSQKTVLPMQQPVFLQGGLILLVFAVILFSSTVSKRFWCRNICPLGALLALVSRRRLLQHDVNSACTACGLCQSSCRMAAIADDLSTSAAECIECGECLDTCPEKAIHYAFRISPPQPLDLSRRHVIQAGLLGVSGVVFGHALGRGEKQSTVIRPPGALQEKEFVDACIRCLQCVKICNSTGGCLQPTFLQAGWEGLWTPRVEPGLGYCEFDCTLCGQVCPSGAIRELQPSEKKKTKIARAVFDKNRCIPWAAHKDCLVCEEHCPVADKAIKFERREISTPDGDLLTVKLPYVVEELCIGCGICEYKCPVSGDRGIVMAPINRDADAFTL